MYKNILLPLDLTDDAGQQKAINTALHMAGNDNESVLHAITVVPSPSMSLVDSYFPKDHADKMMADAQKQLADIIANRVGDAQKCKRIIAYGTIYSEILDYARKNDIDLIVMSSNRPELKDYLIGPNAARVTRHADASIVIVRP